ncbi:hypothetical protein Tco_0929276, partial [Tanacetum coccineum]
MKILNDIVAENDIVVELDDLSPVLKQGEGESKNNVIKTISSGLADDFDDMACAITAMGRLNQTSIPLYGETIKEYPAKIHVRSKLHYFLLIKDRLNEACRSLFRITCFRPWLDITYVENDDVTGFKFGMVSFCEYKNGVIPFRNRLFLEKIRNDVKIIDVLALIEDEEKFSKVSDEDEIRLCLLLSLEVIFMGRELVSVVDDVLLIMVDNLDAWNTFPWDEHIWRKLYDSIRNVSSKHKLEHLDRLRKNPNHVPSYSLSGFLFAFKIVGGPKCQNSSPEQWHGREKHNFSSWSRPAFSQ